ncbi:MAG: gamma-glutamyl-gamma-aminobutyrate hydrolase family protein [Armatimonadia bacterium]
MIAVISMDQQGTYDQNDGGTGMKRKFEKLTGAPVVTVHYSQASPEYMARINPQAVFIGGFGYGWHTIKVPDLYPISDFLHETDVPVYAACGGHQLVGYCFNHDLRKVKQLQDQPMRKLRADEPDYGPRSYCSGFYMATGYAVVETLKRDPLFAGLKKKIRVRESHYCEVKKLPKGFELLATSSECKIEAMKHPDKPLYGCQFHAETWMEPYLDGRKVMENFFRIAGLM